VGTNLSITPDYHGSPARSGRIDIALIATQPSLIVARKTMPAKDLKELIAWLKINADKATQGTPASGRPATSAAFCSRILSASAFSSCPTAALD